MDEFSSQIYKWYNNNERKLPWRLTKDPYKIWISEIILQQTRVAQGTDYYLRFIKHFPTVNSLARANEDEVLKLWQGLGYYTRARNLHATAKYISKNLNNQFPSTYEAILNLKGIGKYTAAAICSFAFDLPYPAIDGNVYRVLTRYFGIETPIDTSTGKKEVEEIATELMPKKNAGFHNQAIMEFGALQCVPHSPNCTICPLLETCYAAQHKKTNTLPLKIKKNKIRNRFFYYFYIQCNDFTFLEKRTKNDIWKNLYQFPLIEKEQSITESEIFNDKKLKFLADCNPTVISISEVKKHILSHQKIFARLINIEIKNTNCLGKQFIQVNKKDISTFAVPKLLEFFFEKLDF